MEFDQWFNLGEGISWILLSLALLTRVRRFPRQADVLMAALLAFLVFGVSDFIEISTRAWFRPVWLLLLKAGCVVTLGWCLAVYRRRRRGGSRDSASE